MRYIVELTKLCIAYICTFGVVIVPVPALWVAVLYRTWKTDWIIPAAGGCAIASVPLFIFGLYTSFRLGEWFLDNWGQRHIDGTFK